MKYIREIIRNLIKEKGTFRKVAGDLGMDHANLLRSLRDDSNPGLKTIEKILDYLGYDIKFIKRKEVKLRKSKPSR